jgi:serine/threonine protein phosphatase PrpC
MVKANFIADSLRGTRHAKNEDGLLIIDENNFSLFVVFDGVSSAKNSIKGVLIASDFIKENLKSFFVNSYLDLQKLMHAANNEILNSGVNDAYTTFVALYIDKINKKLSYSGLGDSRLYGVSKQYIKQYSKDDKNKFSESITKCLGMKELAVNDFKINILPGKEERLLLCTDGFYVFLESQKLDFFNILNFSSLNNIKKRIKKDIDHKNVDDASYIIIN